MQNPGFKMTGVARWYAFPFRGWVVQSCASYSSCFSNNPCPQNFDNVSLRFGCGFLASFTLLLGSLTSLICSSESPSLRKKRFPLAQRPFCRFADFLFSQLGSPSAEEGHTRKSMDVGCPVGGGAVSGFNWKDATGFSTVSDQIFLSNEIMR